MLSGIVEKFKSPAWYENEMKQGEIKIEKIEIFISSFITTQIINKGKQKKRRIHLGFQEKSILFHANCFQSSSILKLITGPNNNNNNNSINWISDN